MREVFLSHASQDRAHAQKLSDILVEQGIPVWFSPKHIRGAQQWQEEIGKALARCDWFMVLLTPNSVKSMWVKRELNYALIEKRYEERILPLLLKKCRYQDLSWVLPQFQWIDFTNDYERGMKELVGILKKTPRTSGKKPGKRG